MPSEYNFRRAGVWNANKLRGGVYYVPDVLRNLKVRDFHVQWLSSFEEGDLETSKNHMCFRLLLSQPIFVGGNRYFAVMLSMEPNENATGEQTIEGRHGNGLECGRDFIPGIFTLKMLPYDNETFTSAFSRQYPIARGVTIGRFIDTILELGMDEFLFELYTWRGAKKGCGHFAVRAYEVWLNKGLITDPRSIQQPHNTLPQDILRTYFPNGTSLHARVGRGTFLRSKAKKFDIDTNLVYGETLWSGAAPRAHLIINGWDVDGYYAELEEADRRRRAAWATNAARNANN